MANACRRKLEAINFMQLFLALLPSWNQFLLFNSKEYCIHLFAYNMLGNISSPVPLTSCLSLSLMKYLSFLSKIIHWNLIIPLFSSSPSNVGPLHQEFLDKLLTTLSDISSE